MNNRFSFRIQREIDMIKKEGYEVSISFNNNFYFIFLIINKFNICIKLNCRNHIYPFCKPTVYINDKFYCDFLLKISNTILYLYDKKNCLCCDTILKNWVASRKLINLIHEIHDHINIIQKHNDIMNSKYVEYKLNLPPIIHTYFL